MQAPPLRWGFLGTGRIAHRVAAALRAGSTQVLQAVGSRSLAKAQAFAAHHGIPQAFGSYQDLVASPTIDAVYVATPNSKHHAHARLALEAGKPVIVEKPFTLTHAQARDLATLAQAKRLFLMEAMWTRFLPHHIELKRRVEAGDLGALTCAFADFGGRDPVDLAGRMYSRHLGGGALYDRGVYPLAWITDLLGLPSAVRAHAEMTTTGVDAHLTAILTFDAASAIALCTMTARTPARAWLSGTRGFCEIPRFWAPAPLHFTFADGRKETWAHQGVRAEGFEYEFAAAARAITAGDLTHPLMPLTDTLALQQLLDNIRSQVGLTWPA